MFNRLIYVFKWLTKAIYHPFLYIIYGIIYLIPRKKENWVFIPHRQDGFGDNCKYFFLFLVQGNKNICLPTWMTKNKKLAKILKKRGYNSLYCFSLKGIITIIRAKYFIFDSYLPGIYFWLSAGSKKINLWHGVGIKTSDNDIKRGKLSRIFQAKGIKKLFIQLLAPHLFLNRRTDYFFCTSPLYQKISSSAFNIPKKNIFITGYPRNDIFFKKIKDADIGIDFSLKLKIEKFKSRKSTILLYIPTFRDTKEDIFRNNILSALSVINEFSRLRNILFIFKPHPNSYKSFQEQNLQQLKNVYFAKPNSDIYPLLPLADALITDYSSISSDYLLLNKPILFFPYDLKKYINEDRDFYFDYESFSPGIKAYNLQELMTGIDKILAQDSSMQKREKIRKKYFQYIDGNSSSRILSIIKNKEKFS
jgi:CDP-glycerol glycerophosphotransferase (TagB/SpsB family)